MSAFTMAKAHIDGLVNAALQLDVITLKETNRTGRLLWEQNYRSISRRYGSERTSGYTFERASFQFHLVAILSLVHCYDYQSCEAPGWDTSPARALSLRIRHEAQRRLPAQALQSVRVGGIERVAYQTLPVWDDTPWGVSWLGDIPALVAGECVAPAIQKGFPVGILTGPYHSPNAGLSAHHHEVVVVERDGRPLPQHLQLAAPSQKAPAVSLRFEYGRYVARPTDAVTHYMTSGAFLHTSDARWQSVVGHRLPIPLHDRTE